MELAKWWHPAEKNTVICDLCPQNCIIGKGKIGFCGSRKNIDGKLYTLNYGRPIAIQIDPIEKKPLYHFYSGSDILSVGTVGCNFECQFCQNHQISRNPVATNTTQYYSPSEIVDIAIEKQCPSIAFTYNEPTIFGEYLLDIAKIAKKRGLKTVMVTNGYINQDPLKEIYQYIDAANVDLKAMEDDFYEKLCAGKLDPVLNTIKLLHKMNIFLEITNLIIPDYNDSEKSLLQLIHWIKKNLGTDIPLHFSAFYPAYKMQDVPRTPGATLEKVREMAVQSGLNYVYVGNIMSPNGYNTYCPNCKKLLIHREAYQIIENNLQNGQCSCGQKINIIQ